MDKIRTRAGCFFLKACPGIFIKKMNIEEHFFPACRRIKKKTSIVIEAESRLKPKKENIFFIRRISKTKTLSGSCLVFSSNQFESGSAMGARRKSI